MINLITNLNQQNTIQSNFQEIIKKYIHGNKKKKSLIKDSKSNTIQFNLLVSLLETLKC